MATYYVTSGAGGAGVGSEGDPWTLAQATAGVSAGDTVWIKADGTYSAQDGASGAVMSLQTSGDTTTGWIAWRGYTTTIGDGGVATLDASVNTLTNVVVNTSATTGYNCFINLRFTGASGVGLNFGTAADNWGLRNCEVDTNGGLGIQADDYISLINTDVHDNSAGAMDADNDVYTLGCKFYNNTGATVVQTQGGGTIIGCIFYNNGNNIALRCSAGGISITNNTFDGDSAGAAEAIQVSGSASTPMAIVNNIIMDFASAVTFGGPYGGNGIVDNNMFVNVTTDYTNYSGGYNDVDTSTDPFTSSSTRDYSLATSSAAIDAGVDAS